MTSDPPFRRRSRRLLPGESSGTSEPPTADAQPTAEQSSAVQPDTTEPAAVEGKTGERPKRTIIGLGLAPRPDLVAAASRAPKPNVGATGAVTSTAAVPAAPKASVPAAPKASDAPAVSDAPLLHGAVTEAVVEPAEPPANLHPPATTRDKLNPPSSAPERPLGNSEASRRKSRRVLSSDMAPANVLHSDARGVDRPEATKSADNANLGGAVNLQGDINTSGGVNRPGAVKQSEVVNDVNRIDSANGVDVVNGVKNVNRVEVEVAPLPPVMISKREGRSPIVIILKWMGLTVGLVVLVAAIVAFIAVRRYAEDLPSVEDLKAGYNPPQITRIVAREGTLLATEFTERRTVIPFEQIPNPAKLAFLAAEDASFYEHEGINYLGLGRAVFANLRAGKTVQGGSTITQQVVKNVLLDSSRSLRRKVREFLLALRLERSLSKDEIFWLYLNHIYLGHGRYGIEEAARYYFGKRAAELGLDEAAVLAGITASPEHYSPRRDADKALKRRRFVVGQMLTKGFVTQAVHDQVMDMPLRLAPTTESESRLAPEIVHTAKEIIAQALGDEKNSGGYTIHTTIDPELQAAGRQALRANLDRYMERHKLVPPYKATEIKSWGPAFQGKPHRNKVYVGVVEKVDDLAGVLDVRVGDVVGQVVLSTETRYNPTGLEPSAFAAPGAVLRVSLLEEPSEDAKTTLRLELGPQSALVAIDVRSREVLATVGSYEALAGGLDRVTQMKRQPGSSFKPIVYSYALHSRRFTPASVIPVQTRGHGVPEEGPLSIDIRDAVAHSNNEAAGIVLQQSGVDNVVAWGKALGIESRLRPDLSLALGSYEVTPLELLGAYVAFASGGMVRKPRFVERIAQGSGEDLALPPIAAESAVMTPEEAYLTTSLLRSVVESGTGRAAAKLQREVAGKTGTTNDSKDTWFIGYSTDIACAVWVGYDDGLPLGKQESGATTALPAWIEFMDVAHKKRPHTRFVRPASILAITVDPTTGLLAGPGQADARMEEFLPGTEPTEIAPPVEGEDSSSSDSDSTVPTSPPANSAL